ncbi:hypothetical protein FBEOM_14238 [Fusarium beomiforme]|uniref:Antifungal protein n=1 Tax=Fusarium beomiforme TaxID=44412 RepID=A0A9P5DM90_9HYPO|nr:hypothetical protein FBEOM_14238 [Fusarium beomiforme]
MKLSLATVGCVLLGFAAAFPEPGLNVRGGETSCSSCKDRDTCGKKYGCHWEPKYECKKKDDAPGKGKECSEGGRADNGDKCNKHPWCHWICVDQSKGDCKEKKW